MITFVASLLLQVGGLIPRGTRVDVFSRIFIVFLVLGTLVGIVVIAYMLQKAYRYRASAGKADGADRPELGEIPTGGGGGKKLFLSFGLSTIIVVSLIVWTYGTLLYVEGAAATDSGDQIEIEVTGYQFGWSYTYPNGATVDNTLRIPVDTQIRLQVTSRDVFHNYGIPSQRVKVDAMPGQTTSTWFEASETGTYTAQCYELCGVGHSFMESDVVVMEPGAYQEWYANTTAANESAATAN